MQFGKIKVDGINIFYRTAGKQGKPTLVGAEAFLQDVPDAEIHLVDSGHFALESRCGEIAEYIKRWLKKVNK